MSNSPIIIDDTNLSKAWYTALEHIINSTGMEISPLVITLTEFDELSTIRKKLDSHLDSNRFPSIQTVSETIFPESLYQLADKDRFTLYNQYLKNLPRIKKIRVSAPKLAGKDLFQVVGIACCFLSFALDANLLQVFFQ